VHGRLRWFLTNRPEFTDVLGAARIRDGQRLRMFNAVGTEKLLRVLGLVFDPEEFLSPYGLRTVSRRHAKDPFAVTLGGARFTVDYEPAESTTGLFGGNSNWRGPIWFPVNYLIIEGLRRYGRFFGEDLLVEYPTGSGVKLSLTEIADDLARRHIALFCDDERGRRPLFGAIERMQTDPRWHNLLPFPEYFHGDNGAGLGAMHQTGWTALVLDMILNLHRPPDTP
jgi:hypothetical protein